MKLGHVVFILLKVCSIQAEENIPVLDEFHIDTHAPVLTVREGTKVTLTCPKTRGSAIYITKNSDILGEGFITLIDSSNMTDISSKYSFNEINSNKYAFTINRISRDDEGLYKCVNGPASRNRAITVIYGPSERSLQCSSNYNSPIIFYDEINDDFVFNCSTERGKPPVTAKIHINGKEITSHLEIINETRTDKGRMLSTYSLSQHCNETLQNRYFVCNVTQQLPTPYDDYQESCSFGPLHLLPGFSLSVSPSNVTVMDESNIGLNLTCTSNVTGVEITWINIPRQKHFVTNYSRSSVLTILSFKPASYETIFVECSGSYGSRTITANTTLSVMVNAEGHEDENYKKSATSPQLLVACIVSPSIIVILVLVAFFTFQNKKKNRTWKNKMNATNTPPGNNSLEKASTSNHCSEQTLTTTELNMNNANNTEICRKDSVMCVNVIYEPASYGNRTNFSANEKYKSCQNGDPCYDVGNYTLDDDHLVCENVIYQSVSYANKER